MELHDLRIALFSGNYNYVRDGANQALNRLAGYLLRQGADLRVYAPVVENPAFEPTGELIGVPSLPIPLRTEYRIPMGLSQQVRADMARFAPNVVHVSSPDFSGHRAVSWARDRNTPVVASVHTRFDTYMRYYGLGFVEPLLVRIMRRFYRRCDAVLAPSESMAQVLRAEGMGKDIGIWSRGVDRDVFHPGRRDPAWRTAHGLSGDTMVIGFLGRLVMEKGLDILVATITALREKGVPHRVLIIGDGPARSWLQQRVPDAVFTGFLTGSELGKALASSDVLFNPSLTETFGNVTLEAMASGVPVVAAAATGSQSLVEDGTTGRLLPPRDAQAFATALRAYAEQPELRLEHGRQGELRSRDFDWDRINHAVAETYLRVLNDRQARA